MNTVERWRQEGACLSCGGVRAEGKMRCEKCLAEMAAYQRERRKMFSALGRCSHCGAKLTEPGYAKCAKCREADKRRHRVGKYHSYEDVAAMCPYYLGTRSNEIACSGIGGGAISCVLRFRSRADMLKYKRGHCDQIQCGDCPHRKMRDMEYEKSGSS